MSSRKTELESKNLGILKRLDTLTQNFYPHWRSQWQPFRLAQYQELSHRLIKNTKIFIHSRTLTENICGMWNTMLRTGSALMAGEMEEAAQKIQEAFRKLYK